MQLFNNSNIFILMGQLSAEQLPAWQQKRILSFFNKAKTATDITTTVLDDPNSGGTGSSIGEVVAKRILAHRNTLIPRFFREFSQLDDVQGLGPDKFKDLAYTFRHTAAEEFTHKLFHGVIHENWKIERHDRVFSDAELFQQISHDPLQLRKVIGEMLLEIAETKFKGDNLLNLVPYLLTDTYLDHYQTQDAGKYAWALWWYRFDSDNWFSFDRICAAIADYLGTYWNEEIELVLVKGFQGGRLWRSGVTDLPVTLNKAEQTISLWRVELFD